MSNSGSEIERYGNVVVTRADGRITIETSAGVITIGADGSATVAGSVSYSQTPQGDIIVQTNEGPVTIPATRPAQVGNEAVSSLSNVTPQVQTPAMGGAAMSANVSVPVLDGDEYNDIQEAAEWSQDDEEELAPQPQRPASQRRQQRRAQNIAIEPEPDFAMEDEDDQYRLMNSDDEDYDYDYDYDDHDYDSTYDNQADPEPDQIPGPEHIPEPEPIVHIPEPEPMLQIPEPEPILQSPQPEPILHIPEPEPMIPQPEPILHTPEPEPVAVLQIADIEPELMYEQSPEPEAELEVTEPELDAEPHIIPQPTSVTNPRYRRTNRGPQATSLPADLPGATQSTEFIAIHRDRPPLTETKYLAEDMHANWREIYTGYCYSDENVFHETKGYFAAKKCLWYRGWVTITGVVGDGKSAMANHLLLHFVKSPRGMPEDPSLYEKSRYRHSAIKEEGRECYKAVIVKTPEDWIQKVNKDEKQVVLIDDIFGSAAYTIDYVEKWRPLLQDILLTATYNRPNTLVIITAVKQHLEKLPIEVHQLELFKPKALIDLSEMAHRLDSDDREQLLRMNCNVYYHSLDRGETRDLLHYNLHTSFPLACRMFSSCRTFHVEGNQFFQNPWSYIEKEIDKAFKFDKLFYATLAVTVLNDGVLDLDRYSFSEYEADQQKIFRECIQAIGAPPETDLAMMRYAAKMLSGFYLVPYQKFCWKFLHERMFHLVGQSVRRKLGGKVVELCSLKFLTERLRTGSYYGGTNESCVQLIYLEYGPLYQRVTYEILSGHVRLMAQHICFSEERFATQWFTFMREMGSLQTVMSMKDKVLNRSFFYWCCYYGGGFVVKETLLSEDLQEMRSEPWFVEQFAYCLQAACCCSTRGGAVAVEALLNGGADVNSKEKYEGDNVSEVFSEEIAYLMSIDATPIHFAAQRGHHSSVKHLIAKGANVNEPAKDCLTPLHRGARHSRPEYVKLLFDAGADINKATPLGRLPFHEAVTCGNARVIDAFCKAGVDLKKAEMDDGRSLFAVACANGQSDMIWTLLREKCSPNGNPAKEPWPPLHLAVGMGHKEIVDTLMYNDIDINLKGAGGMTALHLAVLFHYEKLICLLIEKGADINAVTSDNKTPLHIAAAQGYFDCCNMLLDRGAKPDVKTTNGETPVTLAGKGGFGLLCKILIMEGVEVDDVVPGSKDKERDMMDHMMMRHPMYRDMMFPY